eukprot:CAMPEP_0184504276 /NCGR_PEP_ID=MMETSP0113_2-20130426/52302_1 /TAXON_ID=91329 /ORGANISM="Norrisiella sphaerica, Strain BC52" /LENGTH=190 /DNA_ID=CAMNT_0026893905 /DNA_START=237 /DNA_END=806 /DNA_ORIENTATION=+
MGSKGSRCHDEEATEELIRMSWRLACNTYSVSRRSTDSKSSFKSSVNLTSSPINAHSRDVACDKASPKVLRFSTKDDIVEESDLRAFHEEFVAQFLTYCPDIKHTYPMGYLIIAKMIISFISCMVDREKLDPMIKRFVNSHLQYDLRRRHFDGFGHAIVMTVHNRLGPLATVSLLKIWARAMGQLVDKMW